MTSIELDNLHWMNMSFWIHILLVIWIIIPCFKSQGTVLQTKMNCEAKLSEMNARMEALEGTIKSNKWMS